MKVSELIKPAILVLAGLAVTMGAPGTADAQKKVNLKMQSAFGGKLAHLGPSGIRSLDRVDTMSGGKFKIKFIEPGALVPALGEYMAWKWFGGGNEIRDKFHDKHDLIGKGGFAIGPETSGWFKFEVTDLEQMKGLKMRFFGMGGRALAKIGISVQLLAGGDIYPALERGVIQAAEFSMPTIDIGYGFYQIAKHNYLSGWHQQVSAGEFLVNKTKFNALNESYQAMIDAALSEQLIYTYAESEAQNSAALIKMSEKYRVIQHRWKDEQLAIFEKAWNEVFAEESASDPTFKEFADSYTAFRAKYKPWGDAQKLKDTYLD